MHKSCATALGRTFPLSRKLEKTGGMTMQVRILLRKATIIDPGNAALLEKLTTMSPLLLQRSCLTCPNRWTGVATARASIESDMNIFARLLADTGPRRYALCPKKAHERI